MSPMKDASSQILTALIALLGIAISVLVSSITSRRAVSVELQKLRVQLQGTYDANIIERRVATYPALYSLLSDLVKVVNSRMPSKEELEELRDKVEGWDSRNAIFLGRDTTNICYGFRMTLIRAISLASQDADRSALRHCVSELMDRCAALELGLRSDLGIYGLEDSGTGDIGIHLAKHY
jgi:DNA-binding transcriptional ArsR family regulator